jgi:hypothetical protein
MHKEPEFLPEHEPEVLDEWHDHVAEAPPQVEHASHVNALALGIVFLGGVITVVLTVVLVVIYFNSVYASTRARRLETTVWAQESFADKVKAKTLLEGGGEVPGEVGVTLAPQSEVMDVVIREYADMRADAN